jgi:hypothetical protein
MNGIPKGEPMVIEVGLARDRALEGCRLGRRRQYSIRTGHGANAHVPVALDRGGTNGASAWTARHWAPS